MFDVLFEGSLGLYILLGLIALFLLYLWRQQDRRGYRNALGVVVLIGLLLFLFDLMRETEYEKTRGALDEVIVLINSGEYDRAFASLTPDFEAYGIRQKEMRQAAEGALKRFAVRNIRLKRFTVEKKDRGRRTITLRFGATAESNLSEGWALAECEVDFVIDPEGKSRIKSFRVYNPIGDNTTPWDPFNR